MQDGRGSPTTIVHLFDYPYEDIIEDFSSFFVEFGVVKEVGYQNYLRNGDTWCIATGTRLVVFVLSQPPPRMAIINGSTIANLSTFALIGPSPPYYSPAMCSLIKYVKSANVQNGGHQS